MGIGVARSQAPTNPSLSKQTVNDKIRSLASINQLVEPNRVEPENMLENMVKDLHDSGIKGKYKIKEGSRLTIKLNVRTEVTLNTEDLKRLLACFDYSVPAEYQQGQYYSPEVDQCLSNFMQMISKYSEGRPAKQGTRDQLGSPAIMASENLSKLKSMLQLDSLFKKDSRDNFRRDNNRDLVFNDNQDENKEKAINALKAIAAGFTHKVVENFTSNFATEATPQLTSRDLEVKPTGYAVYTGEVDLDTLEANIHITPEFCTVESSADPIRYPGKVRDKPKYTLSDDPVGVSIKLGDGKYSVEFYSTNSEEFRLQPAKTSSS